MVASAYATNPKLDLVLERVVDVPPDAVWKAWTTPEIIVKWFTPAPWQTVECRIDLRPGGEFFTVMQSPEGEQSPAGGCYLEVEPNRKLVWTSVLGAGYRPVAGNDLPFTGVIMIEPEGIGTRYTAIAIHSDEAMCQQHADMGFHDGWGKVLDQLVEVVKQG